MRSAVPSFPVVISTDIDVCTPIQCESSAITSIYPPSDSDLQSVALYACDTRDGVYSPCKERDPSNPTTQIDVVIPITLPGNYSQPPSTYDKIWLKFLGTFGSATEETIPATRKN